MNYRDPINNANNTRWPIYSMRAGKQELAQASVPYQHYTVSYPPMEALEKGTMFPELYKPYEVRK